MNAVSPAEMGPRARPRVKRSGSAAWAGTASRMMRRTRGRASQAVFEARISVASHFGEGAPRFGELAFEGDAERRTAAVCAPHEGLQIAHGFVAPSRVATEPTQDESAVPLAA